MRRARGVLLDPSAGTFADAAAPWRDRVDTVVAHAADAMLITGYASR